MARDIQVGRSAVIQCAVCVLVVALRSVSLGEEPTSNSVDQVERASPPTDLLSVYVHNFIFSGNTVFTDDQLSQLLDTLINRNITSLHLEEARRILSQHYVDHGYINSGAVLPDQSIADGVIRFELVEGVLSEVIVRGNERLNTQHLQERVLVGTGTPLNLVRLRDRLDVIRQDPNIARVNAQLKPGNGPGKSYLDFLIEENNPFHVQLGFSNNQSASLGAEQLDLLISHTNLTGFGDSLQVNYGITDGGWDEMGFAGDDDMSFFYTIPIGANDVTLTMGYETSDTIIIEEPFDTLDINSEAESVSIALRVPIYRTANSEFAFSFSGQRATSRTFLGDRPQTLSPGAQRGVSKVTALRFAQEWSRRSQLRALAVRSTFSLGIDALDATENSARLNGTRIADGKFFAWLGQFQYVQKIGNSHNQLVVRANVQLTDDPLMSTELLSIGGLSTVRGYRENQMVADKGFVASIESRIPVLFDSTGNGMLFIVPFLDVGLGKNVNGTMNSQEITSLGIGAILHLDDVVDAEVYWGHPFRDFDNSNDNLQDKGILFKVVLTLH